MKLHNVLINYSSLKFYHFLKKLLEPMDVILCLVCCWCAQSVTAEELKVAEARRIECKKKTCLPITFSTTGKTKIFFKYHVICSRKKCKALNFIMRDNLRVRPAGVMSALPSPKRPRQHRTRVIYRLCMSISEFSITEIEFCI